MGSFSVETKLRKVQKVTILTYLQILFAERCWEQLDKAWHSLTSAASPSPPDANPFPDDMEGGVLQPPWSSPLPPSERPGITQTQYFCETEGYSSTRCSKLPSPRAAIHGVAKSQTRLSDWTELNWWTWHSRFLCNIALHSIGPCFYHQSYPQLGIVFALAPSLHSFWSYFSTDLQ